ncbi:2OG-Fe(II) oxygenase [Lysobacter gummosus]|nr:2OG-Fe(II) oxygenase superfamily protein [Lysobacter gummosus]
MQRKKRIVVTTACVDDGLNFRAGLCMNANATKPIGALTPAQRPCDSIIERIENFDWTEVAAQLDASGRALLPGLLNEDSCAAIAQAYHDDARYRSRVVMARHGFGRGEYRYFRYPLPDTVQTLRESLYPRLAPIASRWNRQMGVAVEYPQRLDEFLARCHDAGQTRPTPLLLRYGEGDYNCLHQDLYGEHVFPLQVAILLSQPGRDFDGGEFVLTEQRPRMQSRVDVVPLHQGDAVVFAVHQRPVSGVRGHYRVNLRHGVSRLHAGQRHTLGVIFHDAS